MNVDLVQKVCLGARPFYEGRELLIKHESWNINAIRELDDLLPIQQFPLRLHQVLGERE